MSYYEGLSCPVCKTPFAPDDDIVVCPQCGLPHHRACWKSIGHCFAHDQHGTEQQWSKQKAQTNEPSATAANVCPQCGTGNAQYAEFCSRCGASLSSCDWHSAYASEREYAPYHVSNEASTHSFEYIDNVSANDLAAMVGSSADYYIPRFRRLSHGQSGGWNWAAFLFSPYWLFYRKQYALGVIYLAVFLLNSILHGILSVSIPTTADAAAIQIAAQELQSHALFYPYMVVMYIWLAMKILLGIKGNAFYLSHCKNKIRIARKKTPDISSDELRVSGGISVGMTILMVVVVRISIVTITNFLFNWV